MVAYIQRHLSKACTYRSYRVKVSRQSLSWITPQIGYLMNVLYTTPTQPPLKRTGIQDFCLKYRTLRIRITHEVGQAKTEYYTDLFKEVNNCKPHLQDKAETVNEHFSTTGEKRANELPPFSEEDCFTHITRVPPTVINMELKHDAISEGLEKLTQGKKACGPDKVAPRLLKSAGGTIIPSLISIYCILLTAVGFLPTREERPELIKRDTESDAALQAKWPAQRSFPQSL